LIQSISVLYVKC